jgi:hypothetical protein
MAAMLGIQILGVLFGIFMGYLSFLHLKRKEFHLGEFSFWLSLWLLFIVISIFPSALDSIVGRLNFARRLDFFIVGGFMFLIGVTFHNYSIVRRNQNRLEMVVRKLAIRNARKK